MPDTGEFCRLDVQTAFRIGNNTVITLPCGVTVGLCRRQSESLQITDTLVRLILSGLSMSSQHSALPVGRFLNEIE